MLILLQPSPISQKRTSPESQSLRLLNKGWECLTEGSPQTLLGGSWVVISGVISPLIWVVSIATLLITPLTTTHEPPSRP